MDVRGKGVLVAGGTGDLGRVVVDTLRERHAHVAVLDARRADVAVRRDDVTYVVADATDDNAVADGLATIVERLETISVLVNCIGLIHSEPIVSLLRPQQRRHAVANWQRVIQANLTTSFIVGAHVAEHMAVKRVKGVIINFSSVAATGNAGQTAYSAAKAGVEAMTRVWARELGPFGIRAVAIAPGFVDTPSMVGSLDEATIAEWKRETPLHRLATSAEIAHAVMFAIENDFFSGRTLGIDGGLSMLG